MPEKPRWVDCADKAAAVLDIARDVKNPELKDTIVNEAHAWMRLADIYRFGNSGEGESNGGHPDT